MKKSWCPTCQMFVEYEIKAEMYDFAFDGVQARYNKKTAFCPNCKNFLNVPDIIEQNVKARIDALYEGGRVETDGIQRAKHK